MMRRNITTLVTALLLSTALGAPAANAISRTQILGTAEAYAAHIWSMLQQNLTASCDSSYSSVFTPGQAITGVAYKWGGFDSLSQYDTKLGQGYGAGSYPSDGVLSCVTGVDCSGFVSRTWGTSQKYGTATIHQVSHPIDIDTLVRGDAINDAGHHIVLWEKYAGDGAPIYYEANIPKVVHNTWSTWSYLAGFEPIRYDSVDAGVDPQDAPPPIIIRELPYHDARDTTSGASLWSSYSCAPTTGEAGPEIVYLLQLDVPGTLTATVADGPGVDVDVHLLSAQDPAACVLRNDLTVGPTHLAAGLWVLVADSWSNASGVQYAGAYTFDVTFTADAGACAANACGLVCGACGAGSVCEAGVCQASAALEPCGEVSFEGECDGAALSYCSDAGLVSGVCSSGCCGWVAAGGYYDCFDAAACGSCQDECAAGTHGCSQGNTHAWTCAAASGANACRTRAWTPCEGGCDPSTGACSAQSCTPSCVGRACGPDGCGGICGTCAAGTSCDGGVCVAACAPACGGNQCGADGCGGSCGTCTAGSGCVSGQCVAGCTADCAGKACGDDGCGGSCGSCAGGGSCVAGACTATCVPSCGGQVCGPDGCGGQCGTCPGGDACVGGTCQSSCTASCGGNECGDDGCGGSCGACASDWVCSVGQCVPPGPAAPASPGTPERRAHAEAIQDGGGCAGGGTPTPWALALLALVALAWWRRARPPEGARPGAASVRS